MNSIFLIECRPVVDGVVRDEEVKWEKMKWMAFEIRISDTFIDFTKCSIKRLSKLSSF